MRALLELFRARRREFALSHGLRALLRGSCGNRSRRGMSLLASRLRYLWITLAVVVLDRATKAWFESQTPLGWRHEVISNFVYLVHSRNPGIAFGVLSDSASVWTRVVLIGGSVAVIVVLAWLLVSLRGGGQSGGPYRSWSGNGLFRGSARFLRLAGFQRGRFRHHHRRDPDHPRSHLQPA